MADNPEGFEYQDYELPVESRASIREIERCIKEGTYTSETDVRDHIDVLENIDKEMTEAFNNERAINHHNVTLKHDQAKVQRLIKKLEEKLVEFDRI
jgi:hypothetical protein